MAKLNLFPVIICYSHDMICGILGNLQCMKIKLKICSGNSNLVRSTIPTDVVSSHNNQRKLNHHKECRSRECDKAHGPVLHSSKDNLPIANDEEHTSTLSSDSGSQNLVLSSVC